jgi:hypothetical protein
MKVALRPPAAVSEDMQSRAQALRMAGSHLPARSHLAHRTSSRDTGTEMLGLGNAEILGLSKAEEEEGGYPSTDSGGLGVLGLGSQGIEKMN